MNNPYFLWDYNLNDEQVRAILAAGNQTEKEWLTARILTNAQFDDVWKYLKITDIVSIFPKLRLKASVRDAWLRALTVWGYHVQAD